MRFLFISILLLVNIVANAQGNVDQEGVRSIVERQIDSTELVPLVRWGLYTLHGQNNKEVISILRQHLDSIGGAYTTDQKLQIIELANRCRAQFFKAQQQLLIPESFPLDYKAYSPFPFSYATANALPKLFVIDKFTQTFGAYEHGKLVHWGLLSSGKRNNLTPAGRYNFNWKTQFKLSDAAPKGQKWKMYWVFDFYAKIGLHVHQYSLPINKAVSHGCVRVIMADAEWNYKWANGWVVDKNGTLVKNGTPVIVINDNPKGNAKHWEISSKEVVSLVKLPSHLDDLPIKAATQKYTPWESGW